jgi:glycerophosphoryl diester phosphodiesterase
VAPLTNGSRRLVPLVSAHRAGSRPECSGLSSRAALQSVLDAGCDLIELDVRRTRDGVPVVQHDEMVLAGGQPVPVAQVTVAELVRTAGGCLPLEDALQMLAGRSGAHLDLKQVGGPDDLISLISSVVVRLGAENVVVTGLSDDDVATVRAWSRRRYPTLLVGLAVGRDLFGLPPLRMVRTAFGDIFPAGRLSRSDASLIVCQKTLARAWIARWARRRGLPLLVWTVNEPAELRRWLASPRTWAVTTDHPRRALALRGIERPPSRLFARKGWGRRAVLRAGGALEPTSISTSSPGPLTREPAEPPRVRTQRRKECHLR